MVTTKEALQRLARLSGKPISLTVTPEGAAALELEALDTEFQDNGDGPLRLVAHAARAVADGLRGRRGEGLDRWCALIDLAKACEGPAVEASPAAVAAPPVELATGAALRVLAHEQGLAPRTGETDAALRASMLRRMGAGGEQLGQELRLAEASAALARPVARAGDLVEIRMPAHNAQPFFIPDELAKALQHLDRTPAQLASVFTFVNQVGPMPAANGNEAPPEPPGVVQLRADLGAVASAAARVLGLLGCPFPAVHRLTFDADGWQVNVDAGCSCSQPWRLRANSYGDDASAAVRAALEGVAGWLARHTPTWSDRLPGEPMREALTGLQEALATGYARAGGSW